MQIWNSRDTKGSLEWTSLRGAHRKKMLSKLPPFIKDIIPGQTGEKIQRLWMVNCSLKLQRCYFSVGFWEYLFHYNKKGCTA